MLQSKIWFRGVCSLVVSAGIVYLCGPQHFGPSCASAQGEKSGSSSDSLPTIRIRAGNPSPFKDSKGNTWQGDVTTKEGGIEGGETIDRPDDMVIQNTKDQGLYRSEHYSMDSFSYKVPNGKYVVKLHFAETYDGIGGPGDRLFTFKVGDKEFKNFDVWKKAGGPQRAYVESVPVDITDGKLKITFTPQVENPEINGIEIIPADKASADKADAEKSSSK
jgi:hypothetical protein